MRERGRAHAETFGTRGWAFVILEVSANHWQLLGCIFLELGTCTRLDMHVEIRRWFVVVGSLLPCSSGAGARVIGLGGKHLYPLSHLPCAETLTIRT